jgi:hypothetical protein
MRGKEKTNANDVFLNSEWIKNCSLKSYKNSSKLPENAWRGSDLASKQHWFYK